jgi:hypothetical protein
MSSGASARDTPRIGLVCVEVDCGDEFIVYNTKCLKRCDDGILRPVCPACRKDNLEDSDTAAEDYAWRVRLYPYKADAVDAAISKDIEAQVSAANGDGGKSDRPYTTAPGIAELTRKVAALERNVEDLTQAQKNTPATTTALVARSPYHGGFGNGN